MVIKSFDSIVEIREGGVDYDVEITVPWTEYADGESCGNTAHRTKDLKEPDPTKRTRRYFEPYAIS